jgi:hypothetical protein
VAEDVGVEVRAGVLDRLVWVEVALHAVYRDRDVLGQLATDEFDGRFGRHGLSRVHEQTVVNARRTMTGGPPAPGTRSSRNPTLTLSDATRAAWPQLISFLRRTAMGNATEPYCRPSDDPSGIESAGGRL